MITAGVIVLTILTFIFITYPLFRQKREVLTGGTDEDTRLEELQSRRDTTYSMLKELEFDYQSGILTEDDYRELESRYRGKAISILKGIDNLDSADDSDDEIEKLVAELRHGGDRHCSNCRAKIGVDDLFCHHCGTPLGETHD